MGVIVGLIIGIILGMNLMMIFAVLMVDDDE